MSKDGAERRETGHADLYYVIKAALQISVEGMEVSVNVPETISYLVGGVGRISISSSHNTHNCITEPNRKVIKIMGK